MTGRCSVVCLIFFFKQQTAYDIVDCDWRSDVCSSDLLFASLLANLKPGGVLIYETFARGNEAFARPRNPDHLLKSGELLDLAAGKLHVIAYEHGLVEGADISGVKQRLCAVNDLGLSDREDGEPQAHNISRV